MMWFRQVICEGLFQNVYSQFLVMFATCHIESVLGSLIFQGADAPCHNSSAVFAGAVCHHHHQTATYYWHHTSQGGDSMVENVPLKIVTVTVFLSQFSSGSPLTRLLLLLIFCNHMFNKSWQCTLHTGFFILKNHSSSLCSKARTLMLKLSNFTFYWSIHFLSSLQVCLPQQ